MSPVQTLGHTHRLPGSPIDFSFSPVSVSLSLSGCLPRPVLSLSFPHPSVSPQSSFTEKQIFHTGAFVSFCRAFLSLICLRAVWMCVCASGIHRVCERATQCRRLNEPHWSAGFKCLQRLVRVPSTRWGARPADRYIWTNFMIPTRCQREIKERGLRPPSDVGFTPVVEAAGRMRAVTASPALIHSVLPTFAALFLLAGTPHWLSRAPLRAF